MLYEKFIFTNKEKYTQWWKNSLLTNDEIVDEIMIYIYNNKNLKSISICCANGFLFSFSTWYKRRKDIINIILDYLNLYGFKYVKLKFDNWSIKFYINEVK